MVLFSVFDVQKRQELPAKLPQKSVKLPQKTPNSRKSRKVIQTFFSGTHLITSLTANRMTNARSLSEVCPALERPNHISNLRSKAKSLSLAKTCSAIWTSVLAHHRAKVPTNLALIRVLPHAQQPAKIKLQPGLELESAFHHHMLPSMP